MKSYMRFFACLALGVLLSQFVAAAPLRLPAIFASHMVLQQGKDNAVWGEAAAGAAVEVSIDGRSYRCSADTAGRWRMSLAGMEYGGPYTMSVSSQGETVTFDDIYVGEVWLVSGQSNMDWSIGGGVGAETQSVVQGCADNLIRYFNVAKCTSTLPVESFGGGEWWVCSPENIKKWSAVGYFFARNLRSAKGVAVGIVNASWGATNAEAWISNDALGSHPDFVKWRNSLDTDTVRWNKIVHQSLRADSRRDSIARTAREGLMLGVERGSFDDTKWQRIAAPVTTGGMSLGGYWGFVWLRTHFDVTKKIDYRLEGASRAQRLEFWVNGVKVEGSLSGAGIVVPASVLHKGDNLLAVRMLVHWGEGFLGNDKSPLKLVGGRQEIALTGEWAFNSAIEPSMPGWQSYYNTNGVLYNGMINTIVPYGIRGVVWYQGENNASRGAQYRTLLPVLINDWRVRFEQGYLPFITVQLANYGARKSQPGNDNWAELREAQALSLNQPCTGLVVTIDVGEADDIHPRNKSAVGYRAYLQAERLAYGSRQVTESPRFRAISFEGSRAMVDFYPTGTPLAVRGERLLGFAVAGKDGVFHWAQASLDGADRVAVQCDAVANPVAVRYGWGANPEVTLYNEAGLPAVPFRSDMSR